MQCPVLWCACATTVKLVTANAATAKAVIRDFSIVGFHELLKDFQRCAGTTRTTPAQASPLRILAKSQARGGGIGGCHLSPSHVIGIIELSEARPPD